MESQQSQPASHEYRMKVSKSGLYLLSAVLFIVASIPVAGHGLGSASATMALGWMVIGALLLFSGVFMVATVVRSRLLIEESQIRFRIVFREEVFPVSQIVGFRSITTGPASHRVSRRVICIKGRREPIEIALFDPDEFLQTWLQQFPNLDQADPPRTSDVARARIVPITPFWKIAVAVVCVALFSAAAIIWHFDKARAQQRKLAEDARVCRIRAEKGDANAQSALGHIYYHGDGMPQDYTEALHWYGKAADQGDAKAQYAIGYMHYHGQAVSQSYPEALRWYRMAADQGYAKAQYQLGYMYDQGHGVPQDYAEAVRWYRKAAEQGDAWGQDELGFAYYQGKGVPQDYTEAVRWFRQAADQGDAKAQYNLGSMYYSGRGVAQNYAEAARWYRKAADQGDLSAQRALRREPSTGGTVRLSVEILGSILLLISAYRGGGLFDPQQRTTTMAAVLGLLWAGLDVYGYSHFGVLQAMSAVNAFYIAKGLLVGICVAMFIFSVWPHGAKTVLKISGVLFVSTLGLIGYLIEHHHPTQLAPIIRLFSLTGLPIGMSIPSSIFLWRELKKTRGIPGTTGGSEKAPTPN